MREFAPLLQPPFRICLGEIQTRKRLLKKEKKQQQQQQQRKKAQKKAIYYDKTQHTNFRGTEPPFSSYKTTLKEQLNGEK